MNSIVIMLDGENVSANFELDKQDLGSFALVLHTVLDNAGLTIVMGTLVNSNNQLEQELFRLLVECNKPEEDNGGPISPLEVPVEDLD